MRRALLAPLAGSRHTALPLAPPAARQVGTRAYMAPELLGDHPPSLALVDRTGARPASLLLGMEGVWVGWWVGAALEVLRCG